MKIPAPNQVELRWYFASRELTPAEEEHFFDPDRPRGQGLPDQVGWNPPVVKGTYRPNVGSAVPLDGLIIPDAVGEFHAIVLVTTIGPGRWRGEGFQIDGNTPLVSTRWYPLVGE